MKKGRLEAFSDGVLAIILTIMVLEMKVPHGEGALDGTLQSLKKLGPALISYVLSFIYVGIYWSNHHHLFQAVDKVNGKTLWANLNLLFWLSLLPISSGWLGENNFAFWPVIVYGVVLILCGSAYAILEVTLLGLHSEGSVLTKAIGKSHKGRNCILLYFLAIGCAFISPYISLVIYAFVAVIWFIPDARIEKVIERHKRDIK